MSSPQPSEPSPSSEARIAPGPTWKAVGLCILGAAFLTAVILFFPWGGIFRVLGGGAGAFMKGIHVGLAYLSLTPLKLLLGLFLVCLFSSICIGVKYAHTNMSSSLAFGMAFCSIGSFILLMAALIESGEHGKYLQPALNPVKYPAAYNMFHSLDNADIRRALDGPNAGEGRTWQQTYEWAQETMGPQIGDLTVGEYRELASALSFSAFGGTVGVSYKMCLDLESDYQTYNKSGEYGVERKPMIFQINGKDVPTQGGTTLCRKNIRNKTMLNIYLPKSANES